MDDIPPQRQACNLSLPIALVRQARRHTANLSGTVEQLLEVWVAQAEAEARARADATQQLLEGLNRLRGEVGSLADDFPTL